MSNRKTHVIIGGISGGGGYLILNDLKQEEINLRDMVVTSLGGMIGGMLPDYLDPPTNPNHRALAHSILVGGGFNVAVFEWINSLDLHPTLKWFLKGLILGYLSHLILDSTTPRGLPIV